MALEEYRRKRAFAQTPEPPPRVEKTQEGKLHFVVQMHHATRLHYDFRLEMEGVLKSWAVPKGPALDPGEKRLAMMVDHPLDYMHFEGIIPAGNYGAGTVMVWDTGTWEPLGDPAEMLEKGDLKFVLHGKKLKGQFALVHMKPRRAGNRGNEWLLIKKKDEYAAPGWDAADFGRSVLTRRSLEQITADEASGTWESNRKVQGPKSAGIDPSKLAGAVKAGMLDKVQPMLATLVREPEEGADWLYEIKWDGVRAIAFLDGDHLRLQSRSLRDITACYPDLAGMAGAFKASRAVLDGEIVVLDQEGRSSFVRLQQRMNVVPDQGLMAQYPVVYYVFDLLYLDGYDLRRVPLEKRKEALRAIFLLGANDRVRYSEEQIDHGKELAGLAAERQLEGIIGKRRDSLYESRRSRAWLKIKTVQQAEAIIGGYTAPRGSRPYFGSLVLGLERDGKLVHVGNAGSGFTAASQREAWERLKSLRTDKSPFAGKTRTLQRAHWVKPILRARVKFVEWTNEQKMRAPVVLEVFNPLDRGRELMAPQRRTA